MVSTSAFKKYSVLITDPVQAGRKIFARIKYLYMSEILKDEFYLAHKRWVSDDGDNTLRLNYNLNAESVVFDIGGYQGDFAEAIFAKFGCHVFVFEPVREFYQHCKERFANNSKIKCFQYGLSNKDEEIFITDEKDASSLVKVDADDKKSEKVLVRDVAEVIEELKVSQIDLLKINIEGGEFYVLPRLVEKNIIQNIRNLQIQFHNFIPGAHKMRDEIRHALNKTHTETWNYTFVWENWERKRLN